MRSLQKIFFLLLITVFCAPTYATINNNSGVELSSCSVFNEAEGNSGGESGEKKEEEEEPDCE